MFLYTFSRIFYMLGVMKIVSRYFNVASNKQSRLETQEER
jgi:hypothetical protein